MVPVLGLSWVYTAMISLCKLSVQHLCLNWHHCFATSFMHSIAVIEKQTVSVMKMHFTYLINGYESRGKWIGDGFRSFLRCHESLHGSFGNFLRRTPTCAGKFVMIMLIVDIIVLKIVFISTVLRESNFDGIINSLLLSTLFKSARVLKDITNNSVRQETLATTC